LDDYLSRYGDEGQSWDIKIVKIILFSIKLRYFRYLLPKYAVQSKNKFPASFHPITNKTLFWLKVISDEKTERSSPGKGLNQRRRRLNPIMKIRFGAK
jgi:hypothetical protein